ncbi:hypothetical protein EU546_02825 [Candidatus Thorarchaeota archaeon]|nr:MAG: hypothetical protein EU546_02825 [Candidatus Thorarchaeota archaeon]
MSSDNSCGKVVAVCFFTIFVGVAWGMGGMILGSPVPIFVALIPFGMGLFGVVMCIALLRGSVGQTAISYPKTSGVTSYSGDSMSSGDARERRVLYQVPVRCPSCGANINEEVVDWVGPLQAQCPYCNATIEVIGRDL